MPKQVSSNTHQQEKVLLNPFEVSDDQILEKVYITHFHCVEKYDVGSLYNVASNVVNHSIEIADSIIKVTLPTYTLIYIHLCTSNKITLYLNATKLE